MKDDLRALDWSSNGRFIIAADVKGMIYLFEASHLKLLSQKESIFISKEKTKTKK